MIKAGVTCPVMAINLATPQLDSLASSGASFERFYVCPVCSPTRAEFLTGRYHPRLGVSGVSEGKERLNLDESTLAEDFQAAGYATACFGKWHNGSQYPYHPLARGFDEFYGFTSGHWGDYFSPPLEHNGHWIQGDGYIVDDLAERACRFIEAHAHERFFLYLPFPTPHTPMQVPEVYWQRHRDRQYAMRARSGDGEDIDFTRAALAMVENIDDNVGRLVAKLDQLGLTDRTIIVYFSDNGPNSFRWNGDMKGRKGSTDEGGVRSPLFIRWPERIEAGRRVEQISGAIDLRATLTELAGVPRLVSKPLDGISLASQLTGPRVTPIDRDLFSHWSGQVSLRTHRYRLDARGQLFDMLDPGQTRDVALVLADVATGLRGG